MKTKHIPVNENSNWFCHCGKKFEEKYSISKQKDGRIAYFVDLTCPGCGEKQTVLYKTKGKK